MGDLRMLFAEDRNKVMVDTSQIGLQRETVYSLSWHYIFMLACYFASIGSAEIILFSDLAAIN
jgi:hypothetical protein